MKKLTLFFDGKCPLCEAEILFLAKRDCKKLLVFIDINSEQYKPESTGVSCEKALESMYGQIENEKVINGVEVFAEAYKRVDLHFLSWFFSRKWLLPFNQYFYKVFAKNRHAISRIIGPFILRMIKKT